MQPSDDARLGWAALSDLSHVFGEPDAIVVDPIAIELGDESAGLRLAHFGLSDGAASETAHAIDAWVREKSDES